LPAGTRGGFSYFQAVKPKYIFGVMTKVDSFVVAHQRSSIVMEAFEARQVRLYMTGKEAVQTFKRCLPAKFKRISLAIDR